MLSNTATLSVPLESYADYFFILTVGILELVKKSSRGTRTGQSMIIHKMNNFGLVLSQLCGFLLNLCDKMHVKYREPSINENAGLFYQ